MFTHRIIKRRGSDFITALLLIAIAIIPALPVLALWAYLHPAGFWQRFIFIIMSTGFIYAPLLGIELILLDWF